MADDNAGNKTSIVTAGSNSLVNDTYTYNVGTADKGLLQTKLDHLAGSTPPTATGRATRPEGATTTYTVNSADGLTGTPAGHDYASNQPTTLANTALGYNPLSQTSTMTPSGKSSANYSYADLGQNQLTNAAGTTLENTANGVNTAASSGSTASFVSDPQGNLISMRPGGVSYYYLFDGRGSVVGLINSAGANVATYSYQPYGKTPTATEALVNLFRYEAGYTDATSGLIHFGARLYDPTLASWMQLDPSGRNAVFAYAGDNAIKFMCPRGESSGGAIIGFLGTFIRGLAATVATGETPVEWGVAYGATFASIGSFDNVMSSC